MENLDKDKIERIVKTRKQAHAYFSKKSKVFRAFCAMEEKTYEAGSLSVKQKTRLHHRHILFERGSSRDCDAKIRINK